jgi:hypothetical protein
MTAAGVVQVGIGVATPIEEVSVGAAALDGTGAEGPEVVDRAEGRAVAADPVVAADRAVAADTAVVADPAVAADTAAVADTVAVVVAVVVAEAITEVF